MVRGERCCAADDYSAFALAGSFPRCVRSADSIPAGTTSVVAVRLWFLALRSNHDGMPTLSGSDGFSPHDEHKSEAKLCGITTNGPGRWSSLVSPSARVITRATTRCDCRSRPQLDQSAFVQRPFCSSYPSAGKVVIGTGRLHVPVPMTDVTRICWPVAINTSV